MACSSSPMVLMAIVVGQGFILVWYIVKSYSSDIFGMQIWRYGKYNPHNDYDYTELLQANAQHHKRFPSNVIKKSLVTEDEETAVKKNPVLFIGVVSGLFFLERRNAVRESWMKDCVASRGVYCKFFTDGQNVKGQPLDNSTLRKLEKESLSHGGDLVILNGPSGRNFAVRLLNMMAWAASNFEFDFFLRVDDDHYICLDRLLGELRHRPQERLYWGHVHCVPTVVRIDEGWVMLTEDIVRDILKSRNSLMCSRFADQSLAMWIYDLMKKKPITWYGDERIFHHPPSATVNEFKVRNEICHTYISLHGTYPIEQRVYRLIDLQERHTYGRDYAVTPVVDVCPYSREHFNWKWFDPTYYTEPVLCSSNPIWSDGGEVFIGRSIDIREKMIKDFANEKRWREMMDKRDKVKT